RKASAFAKNPEVLALARTAAKEAVRQNLAIPLQIAGYDRATAQVTLDGEEHHQVSLPPRVQSQYNDRASGVRSIMATVSDSVSDTIAHSAARSRYFIGAGCFYFPVAIVLALCIVFAFAQCARRGLVDCRRAPFGVHLPGGLMLAWPALFA